MSVLAIPRVTVLSDCFSKQGGDGDGESDPFALEERLIPIFDILRHKDTAAPLSIALEGAAGTGKTTALKWLVGKIELWNAMTPEERQGHPPVLPVWFSCRKSHFKETVLANMASEILLQCLFRYGNTNIPARQACLLDAVKVCGASLGERFIKGIEKLAAGWGIIDPVQLETAKVEFTASRTEVCLGVCSALLSRYLNPSPETGEPVRIAVFIDDLDYSQPDIMIAVFDAINLYLQFPELVFVVGMDAAVVQSLVTRHFAQHGYGEAQSRLYLSKIFQVECHIEPSRSQLKNFYDEQLDVLDRKTGYLLRTHLTEEYKGCVSAAVLHLARNNPRKIKLYLNSALMNGYAAARRASACGEASAHLHFAQGVQIYLLQRWLAFFSGGQATIYREDVLRWFDALSQEARKPGADYSCETDLNGIENDPPLSPAGRLSSIRPSNSMKPLSERCPPPEGLGFNMIHKWVWDLLKIPFSMDVTSHFSQPDNAQRELVPELAAITPNTFLAASTAFKDALAAALEKSVSDLLVGDLSRVIKLNLSGQHLTDDDFAIIGMLERMEHLNLHSTAVRDLSWTANLHDLKVLNLSRTSVQELGPLAKLPGLTHLDLSYSEVVDLTPLTKHPGLEALILFGTSVKTFDALRESPKLALLNLSHTGVTDADLAVIKTLPELKSLFLRETRVSRQGLVELRQAVGYSTKIEF